jgi:hypothetical protein
MRGSQRATTQNKNDAISTVPCSKTPGDSNFGIESKGNFSIFPFLALHRSNSSSNTIALSISNAPWS